MKRLLTILLLLPVLAACAASAGGKDDAPTEESLRHRRFVLTQVNGEAFQVAAEQKAAGRVPEIEFNEGNTISGRVCNSFHGPAVIKDGVLTAPMLASTMMLCTDQALNRLERDFHAMLRKGARMTLAKGHATLTLKGDDLTLVYKLSDWVR